MSSGSSNNDDNDNYNDNDNNNNGGSSSSSRSSNIDENGTSSTVNRSGDSSIDKNDGADKEHSQYEEHQDQAQAQQQQEQHASKLQQPKAAPIIPLFELDEFGAVISETSNGLSNSFYHYRDFSNVAEKDIENHPNSTGNTNIAIAPPTSRGHTVRVQKFPLKLYAILTQKEFQDVISWMPHGRSWKVLKPNLFESLVMSTFFEYSNYHSFTRLVNAWSFRRVTVGIDRGSYYHEVSQADSKNPYSCARIVQHNCIFSLDRSKPYSNAYFISCYPPSFLIFFFSSFPAKYSCFFEVSPTYKSTCGVFPRPTRNYP